MKTDRAQRKTRTVPDSTPATAANQAEEEWQPLQTEKAQSSESIPIQTNETASPGKVEEEIRQTKIEVIREQLASGTYSISGKDVAAKILNILKG